MAVYPNGYYNTKNPFVSGGGAAQGYSPYAHSRGDRFNRYVGTQWSKINGGTPNGYGPGGALTLPMKAGGISSHDSQALKLTNAGLNVAAGINASGSVSLTLTNAQAQLQLIVSLVGSTTLKITVAPASLAALVGISGSTTLNLTNNTPVLGALAGLFGNATVSINAQGLVMAIGSLAGHITPYTELSPQNLANAVWEALANDHTLAGTMGYLMNSAGSGGLTPEQSAQLAATLTVPKFMGLKDS